ncbi:MAG: hypothetical protein JSR67_02030 [Proteobacteria bacterium]|nr:hypothetical protein [Pseudomonadota bacterium]
MKSGSMARSPATALAILGLLIGHSGGAAAPAAAATPPAKTAAPGGGCLPTGNGYLRARIRGNVNVDLDWRDSQIECDGGPRPDGSGVRVSFAGPLHTDGRRVRLVFGVESAQEGKPGRELPTNLTVIFEGEQRLFATRGDGHCTVDELRQERVGALGGPRRAWRVIARGFCVAPASTLASDARIIVSSFDFAGRAVFEDETP